MNEFERKMLSMMEGLTSEMVGVKSEISSMNIRLTNVENEMSNMNKRITNIENDISEIKEHAEITRVAVNDNGEKLEELTIELKNCGVIS